MKKNQNSNGSQFDSIYFKNYLTSNRKNKFDIKEVILFLGSVCFVCGSIFGVSYLVNIETSLSNKNINEESLLSENNAVTDLQFTEKPTTPIVNEVVKEIGYLDECPIISSDRYTGNEGDSFVYPIGLHEYSRGNTCVDDTSYEHGVEGWVARWNYTDELSWAYSVFDIGGKYKSLSGECKLIQSYNTTDFNTTLEFWNDETLIQSYNLTPDTIPFKINLDVADCQNLKVYFYDTESKSGGTSFGLVDMILSSEAISDGSATNTPNAEQSDIKDCYTGSYTAGQGNTMLDFTITNCDSDYNAEALFLFYASKDNLSVPTGSYKMKGSLVEKCDDGSVKIYFEGTEWIQQPSAYGFINFTAVINPNSRTLSSSDYSIDLVQKNDNIHTFFDGHQYCLFNAPMNAEEAEQTCEAMGGHLISINSIKEQQHFEEIIQNSDKYNIWIGGYYDGESWKWTDDSEFAYSNWDDEKPDNYWGDEYYIKVATDDIIFDTWNMYKNKWDDVSKAADGDSGDVPMSSFGFVCEWR